MIDLEVVGYSPLNEDDEREIDLLVDHGYSRSQARQMHFEKISNGSETILGVTISRMQVILNNKLETRQFMTKKNINGCSLKDILMFKPRKL